MELILEVRFVLESILYDFGGFLSINWAGRNYFDMT